MPDHTWESNTLFTFTYFVCQETLALQKYSLAVSYFKMSTTLEPETLLQAVFHHVVLPSKLPSRNDADDAGLAYDLGSRLWRALAKFSSDHDQDTWDLLVSSMKATAFLNQGQLISHEPLELFQSIASGEKNMWLALFVTQQNAALLIHRNDMLVSESHC